MGFEQINEIITFIVNGYGFINFLKRERKMIDRLYLVLLVLLYLATTPLAIIGLVLYFPIWILTGNNIISIFFENTALKVENEFERVLERIKK